MAEARPVAFREVSRAFGSVQALRPMSLEIGAGEFVTLLGPSGSGKTTLLNIAAGFLAPDRGAIMIGDVDVTSVPPRRRNIGMVFQSYALFPHLNVFENVAYGLRVRGVPAAEVSTRVQSALGMMQLEGAARRSIRQLSGGQQQRVALARALVIEPDVLLMDEPLGALDRQLRKHVQLEIRHLHRTYGRTTLYVTHDQEEALVMSDRIGIMRDGRLDQIGRPDELYRRPANVFVASFLGKSNILRGRVTALDGCVARIAVVELGREVSGDAGPGLVVGEEAGAVLRPEALIDAASADEGVAARIEEIVYLGEMIAVRLELAPGLHFWRRSFSGPELPEEGREVRIGWRSEDVRIVPL